MKKSLNFKSNSLTKFFKNIVFDLKNLPKFAKLLILIICAVSLWNNFFDWNHFIDSNTHPSMWTIINNKNYPTWKQVFLVFSCVATITHITCQILIAFGKNTNYFWGTIAVFIYGLYAITWNYIGLMQLNLFFFLPTQFIGHYFWKKHLDEKKSVIVLKMNLVPSIIILYSIVILAFIFYLQIPAFSKMLIGSYDFDGNKIQNILPHSFDALTNSISIVALILMLMRIREQWILWVIVNIIQITMYAGIAHGKIDLNIIILWTIALLNSFIGIYQWYFVRSNEKSFLKKIR